MTQAGVRVLLIDMANQPEIEPSGRKDADASDVRLQSLMATA